MLRSQENLRKDDTIPPLPQGSGLLAQVEMSFPFNIIESEGVPPGTVLLVPPIYKHLVTNAVTGEAKETVEWNPKAGAVITNVGSPDSGQEKA